MAKRKEVTTICNKELRSPVIFHDPIPFTPVDAWIPEDEDVLFKTAKGQIMLDVSSFFGCDPPDHELNTFKMTSKRSYNNPKMREHTIHYLNYLEKFYDYEHELISIYCRMKYLIDYENAYTKEAFFSDLNKYIMHGSMSIKIAYMNRDNYALDLTYRNKRNPNLIYNNQHGQIMMKISLLMNCMIPLLCHFMYMRGIANSGDFLLEIYDVLIHLYDVDIYSKLYETAISNILKSTKSDKGIWSKQDIRGINSELLAIQCVQNILINIICKYNYDENLVHFNLSSIRKNTSYQVLDQIAQIAMEGRLLWKHSKENPLNCWDYLKAYLPRYSLMRILRRRKSEKSNRMAHDKI